MTLVKPRITKRPGGSGLPVAWWYLDAARPSFAGDVGSVGDITGNTPAGVLTADLAGNIPTWVPGGLLCDGTGYISGPSAIVQTLNGAAFTASVTVQSSSFSGRSNFMIGSPGRDHARTISYGAGGGSNLQISEENITYYYVEAPVDPSVFQSPTNIVWTFANNTSVIYLNGAPIASGPTTFAGNDSGFFNAMGGLQGDKKNVIGTLFDLRIYNYALTPQQVQKDYTSPYRRFSKPALVGKSSVVIPVSSFAASPTTLPANSTTTVTLTGIGTTWTALTTFAVSGVAGCTLSSTTYNSPTSVSLQIAAGSTTGTLTLTDSILTSTVTVAVVPVILAPNNSSMFWPIGSVSVDTNGYVTVVDNGTYFKTGFTGTSFAMQFDVSSYKTNGISSANWGDWIVKLDDGVPFKVSLTDPGVSNLLTLSFASGLAAGSHQIQAWRQINDETDTFTALSQIVVREVILDSGATLVVPSGTNALRPGNVIVFGDSSTKGYNATSSLGSLNYPPETFAQLLGYGLNSEITQVGKSGQGWTVSGTATGSHTFPQTYNQVTLGVARTFTGVDTILVFEGANDTSDITTVVTAWLSAARAAFGPGPKIILGTPFTNHSTRGGELVTAVNGYKAANPLDAKVFVIDSQTVIPITTYNSGGDFWKVDQINPTTQGHAVIAATLAGLIQRQTTATPTPSGVPVSRVFAGL